MLAEFACSAPVSVGNICSTGIQRSAWYYDSARSTCTQFTYLGCGGTANRFSNKMSCISMCIRSTTLGNCPLGMSPHLTPGKTTPQSCTLNVSGTCGGSSSCVRSTSNTPICCDTTATCPNGRTTYIIPGMVLTPNISIRGFYLCCSSWNSNSVALKPAALTNSCPKNVRSNRQSCTVNAVDECPIGYTCIPRKNAPQRGSCCAIQPTCLLGKAKFIKNEQVQICGPELDVCAQGSSCIMSSISSVYICCQLASPIASTRPPQNSPAHRCANGRTPFYDPGRWIMCSAVYYVWLCFIFWLLVNIQRPTCSRFPRQCITTLRGQCPRSFACKAAQSGGLFYCCPVSPNECANGQKAFIPAGSSFPQTCSSYEGSNCAPGYSCQDSADGSTSLCCADATSVNVDMFVTAICPVGSSAYMYGSRPLACPPGSTRCPHGYACTQSNVPNLHLCCSSLVPQMPACTDGTPYIDPVSNGVQFCAPNSFGCPQGFHCQQSTLNGQYICCTLGQLNIRYTGYCPIGQIPYINRITGEPRTCHMSLYPCPTTAPYMCIYSSEKLDSYCCAPIDTAIQRTPDYPVQREDFSGCPSGSKPLVNSFGQIQQCNPGQCPASFICHFASQKGLLYIGQKGCQANEQCSLKLAEARCDEGYCVCPRHKLIHQSKCVTHCPDGFVNIAARCHDLTTVVFMDSVDERNNGTIGGFCEATPIVEKQCRVENAYCNERSITCQCKAGYELHINFGDKNDAGLCIRIKDSRFTGEREQPTTNEAIGDNDPQKYFIIGGERQMSNGTGYVPNVPLRIEDEPDDFERYLFQSDDQPAQIAV
uniref:BPTI/Kunitz inhibitor domain-containing protein n=1 Tax=Ascaris lumbricoides TaxID=6252 RepID=A0A9J2PKY5_ASCLU